jgi:zinc protease
MKMRLFSIFLIIGFLFASNIPVSAQKDPADLKFPNLDFQPQYPDYVQLKKGLELYYIQNGEIPVVNVMIIFKSGEILDPADKVGVSGLTADLLVNGGTKKLTPEQIEDQLDLLGSEIEISGSNEYTQINVWSLKKNFDQTWQLVTEMLNEPRFDENRLQVAKAKAVEEVRRQWDNPIGTGVVMLNQLIFGKDHPQSRHPSTKGLESITREDINQFYQQHIKNREMVIACTGDFKPANIQALLKKSFSNWQCLPAEMTTYPKTELASKPGIYFLNKKDMTQAVVCLGHLGINNLDEDNVEMNVLNFIYGAGSFNSRLMQEIRSNRGLAYMAFGAVISGKDRGPFINLSMTKSGSVNEVITLFKEIMADITSKNVKEEELKTAKMSQVNSFVHRFNNPASVLVQTVLRKLDGHPQNYLKTYVPKIEQVNENKVLEMAKRTIHPDQLITVVIGKKEDIWEQLVKLSDGKVKELDASVE